MSSTLLPPPALLLREALAYHARGWSVFPVTIKDEGSFKKAAVRWKPLQWRQCAQDQLHAMFKRPNLTGLAVALGPGSGNIYSRDFDIGEAYRLWAADHPDRARILPTVATARGCHVYFRFDNTLTTAELDDGELRGCGGYSILPPSVHHTGHLYRWTVPLPAGPLPLVNPVEIGFDRVWCRTERQSDRETELPEQTEKTEPTEETEVPECHTCPGSREGEPGGLLVGAIVAPAVPTKEHENNHQLFTLARSVKADEKRRGRELTDPELREVFEEWHRQATPYLRQKQSRDEYWLEFMRAIESVKYPLGEGVLVTALENARRLAPPKIALQFNDQAVRLLIALCRELQRACAPGPFYLSCRTVQSLLNLPNHRKANDWLRALATRRMKIIQEVEKGSAKTKRASRFKYIPPLAE